MPRLDSLRFRFVPVRFMNGSVRGRFVFDRFVLVHGTARFESIRFSSGDVLQFVVLQGGSSRFVLVRCSASNYAHSHILAVIHMEEPRVLVSMCRLNAVRGGSLRFVAVHWG